MAVVLKNAIFLHIPKTGGEWVRKILLDCELESLKVDKHADLLKFKQHPVLAGLSRPFRFAFVRHPLGWYRSFWTFQSRRGWKGIPEALLHPPSAMGYEDFLAWVVSHHRGFLGRLYERYVGPVDAQIEFVGRTRTLRRDLAEALRRSGHVVPQRAIDTVPNMNVTGQKPQVSTSHGEALMRAEQDTCERFGFV